MITPHMLEFDSAKMDLRGMGFGETGSRSWTMAGFGIGGVEPSSSATTELVN
jgi:hypothetical protein